MQAVYIVRKLCFSALWIIFSAPHPVPLQQGSFSDLPDSSRISSYEIRILSERAIHTQHLHFQDYGSDNNSLQQRYHLSHLPHRSHLDKAHTPSHYRKPSQCRKCTSCRCSICNDLFHISRDHVRIISHISDCSFHINNNSRCTSCQLFPLSQYSLFRNRPQKIPGNPYRYYVP